MKNFRYKTIFSSRIKPLISEDTDKFLAIASKSKLKDYLPKNIDFDKKIDFLGFTGEFCTANRLNSNDDAITTKGAIEVCKLLPLSFLDIEHSRKAILGVITNAYFTEFGGNKILSEEEVKDLDKPFNISIAGIVWRLVNPDLADYIEASGDPDSDSYGKIFISWEILFDSNNLIEIDPTKKNLQDGLIINDPSDIEKLESKLKANGGKGFTDNGKRLGRIPIGEIIPVGAALTESPANEDLKSIKLLLSNIKVIEKDSSSKSSQEIEAKINTGFSDTSTKEAYSGKDKSNEIKNKSTQSEVDKMTKNETKDGKSTESFKSDKDKINPFDTNTIKTTNKDIPPKKPDYKFGKCPNLRRRAPASGRGKFCRRRGAS